MNPPKKTEDKSKVEKPNIFDYLDYRSFLSDMFDFKKKSNHNYSYRVFAGKADFASPNFLKLVITAQRNLTNESIGKMAKGFGLKKQERDFFENLVFLNQASNYDEKDHYYTKMMSVNGYLKSHKIDKSKYKFSHTFRVHFDETDIAGIVHNSNYIK